MDEAKQQNLQQARLQRSADFDSTYANNISAEGSVWDIKLTFGELDQSLGIVDQHTSITMPWSVAKLLIHILQAQVFTYEIQNGKIKVPEAVRPAPVPPPPKEIENEPLVKETFETLKKLREDFMKTL